MLRDNWRMNMGKLSPPENLSRPLSGWVTACSLAILLPVPPPPPPAHLQWIAGSPVMGSRKPQAYRKNVPQSATYLHTSLCAGWLTDHFMAPTIRIVLGRFIEWVHLRQGPRDWGREERKWTELRGVMYIYQSPQWMSSLCAANITDKHKKWVYLKN